MEYENKYSSNAKGNLGVTLGGIGLGAALLNGGLGNILGGVGGCNNGCGENTLVNRYEASQSARISALESELKLRDSNIYTDQKSLEMFKYIDGELKDIRGEMSAQAVRNAQIEGTFAVLGEQSRAMRNEFMCALNRERDERCCGDNSIVNYANATFYPKQVADITTEATTVAQNVYNPLPNCGCRCA